jgi:hypothetical protein
MAHPTLAEVTAYYRREHQAGDRAYSPVLVFLRGAPRIAEDKRFLGNVGESGAIYWTDVLGEGTWSGTEEILIKAAASLFRSDEYPISLGAAARQLDKHQANLLIEMFRARMTGEVPEYYS